GCRKVKLVPGLGPARVRLPFRRLDVSLLRSAEIKSPRNGRCGETTPRCGPALSTTGKLLTSGCAQRRISLRDAGRPSRHKCASLVYSVLFRVSGTKLDGGLVLFLA